MRQLAGLILCWLVATLLAVWATGTGLAALAAIFLVLAIPYAYAEGVGRRRRKRRGLYWKGFVTFQEAPLLAYKGLFPEVTLRNRWEFYKPSGSCAGKAEVRDTGIRWKTGALGTPTSQVTGKFELGWADIQSVEIGLIPGKNNFLGGSIVLTLSNGRGELEGEFIGSRRVVQDALDAARLGYSSQSHQS